jgi:hypothetical protein
LGDCVERNDVDVGRRQFGIRRTGGSRETRLLLAPRRRVRLQWWKSDVLRRQAESHVRVLTV